MGFHYNPSAQGQRSFRWSGAMTPIALRARSKRSPEDGPGGDFEGRGEYGNGRREGQGYEEGWDASGRVAGFVARNPYKTVMTSFGIGFGFGLFVTLLVSRREPSWFERYAPEAIQGTSRSAQASARSAQEGPRIGGVLRSQFLDALVSRDNRKAAAVPLSKRLGPTSPGLFSWATGKCKFSERPRSPDRGSGS